MCVCKQDSLFHDLHELVVCGEVAGMFEKEEVEGILSHFYDQGQLSTTGPGSLGASWHNGEAWAKFVEVYTSLLLLLYNTHQQIGVVWRFIYYTP